MQYTFRTTKGQEDCVKFSTARPFVEKAKIALHAKRYVSASRESTNDILLGNGLFLVEEQKR